MKKKKIIFKTSNSSWWKNKKIRKSTAQKLLFLRKSGWKFKKKELSLKNQEIINTNTFYTYFFYKE